VEAAREDAMADHSDPSEHIDRALKTKIAYKWVDPRTGIEAKSKEEWKNGRKVVHFPFSTRTGRPKYRQIEQIVYEDMPKTLPSGYLKAARTGYGFARELWPVLQTLQDTLPHLRKVIVSGSRDTQLVNRREIVFSNSDLQTIRPRLERCRRGSGRSYRRRPTTSWHGFCPQSSPLRGPNTRAGS
jgi:hypothetical protein